MRAISAFPLIIMLSNVLPIHSWAALDKACTITGTQRSRTQALPGSPPPSFPADHFCSEIVRDHRKPFLLQILMNLMKLPD